MRLERSQSYCFQITLAIVPIARTCLSTAQASSSFTWLDTCTSMSTTPTFITEALRLVLTVTTAVLNDRYSEVTTYTALAYSSFHDVYGY